MGRALRREEGASAVEMALIAPLLFMLVFGIIGFGLAFLQVQSIRTAVREGGRAAAVGAARADVQAKTVDASSGSIPSANRGDVSVSYPRSATNCNSNNIGDDVTVSFPTSVLNSGDCIVIRIPLFPDIHITPTMRRSSDARSRAVIDRRGEEGAVAIIVALLLVVLMAAVALTVDVGGLYLRRRALVNGADAGALAAARTCARGVGHDPRFASAEEAADFEVQANAPITTDEVAPTNLTFPPPGGCAAPSQYGHATVQYTSEQALYFAPVLGFGHTSPVTTTATASWGLGSNNPVPIVLTNLLAPGTCQMPPSGTIAKGQTCTFWYDNDTLNGGNFAFLSLNAAGWDVPVNSNCSGSSSGGTSTLTDWINGTLPASVVLNWRFPTYVCTDTGIRGVGGKGGPHSQVWSALNDLIGQTRDFPINWEGCGTAPFTACPPVPGAPAQGTIYKQGNIDKYDIIGFGAMTILHVYGATDPQVQGTPAQDYTCTGKVKNNTTIPPGVYSWSGLAAFLVGGPCQLPPSLPADSVNSVALQGLNTPADFTYDTNGVTLTTALTEQKNVDFSLHMNAQPGVCGDITLHDRSAVCVITSWQGSTLDADFPPGTDTNTIIRLCDLAYAGSCLDQRPR